MSKIINIGILSLFFLGFTNCIGFRMPLYGSVFTNVTENATILNKDVSQKDGIGSREGESCAQSFLGIVAFGNSGIKSAAAHGRIRDVKSMDTKFINVLGSVFIQQCTKVYGD
jgi:hypothetical protein